MNEDLKKLVIPTQGNPVLIRKDFQHLLDTGYFTINGVMFSFGEDVWNITDSLNPEIRGELKISLDFSSVGNKDAKLKLKLWMYVLLTPYKSGVNNKMKTIYDKLVHLKKCYSFLESKGWEGFFVQPKLFMVEAYRNWLKGEYLYTGQHNCCGRYVAFLEFQEEVWGLVQKREVIDVLKNFDSQKLQAERKTRIRDAIPYEFYQRLHDLCMKTMENEDVDINYRITSAVIVLFSQTGLRNGELYYVEAQPINRVMKEDQFGKKIEVRYIYAPIRKSVRGRDTVTEMEKIPLTDDGEKAFNILMDICKERRMQNRQNMLVVYPKRGREAIVRTRLYSTWALKFYAHYHKELDTLNTQVKYPTLSHRRIDGLPGEEFGRIIDEHGEDAILVFPTPTHLRKTYATILYQNGTPAEDIYKLLNQSSPRVTEDYYIRPFFNQKDFARSKGTYSAVIKHDAKILGKKSTDFMERLKECIEKEELAAICKSDDELVEMMSNIHPLHAKEVGFCLMSDIQPCTVRSDEERLMCAFNTCPNIGFMFYDMAEHYQQLKHHEKAMELNVQEGHDRAAEKELKMMRYLVKTYLELEIAETEREIQTHGKEQIVEWYPVMESILEKFGEIKSEVMAYAKEVVA